MEERFAYVWRITPEPWVFTRLAMGATVSMRTSRHVSGGG